MVKVTAKDAVMVIGLAIGGIVVGIDKTDGSMDIKNPKAPVVHTKITEIGKHRHPTIRAFPIVNVEKIKETGTDATDIYVWPKE